MVSRFNRPLLKLARHPTHVAVITSDVLGYRHVIGLYKEGPNFSEVQLNEPVTPSLWK